MGSIPMRSFVHRHIYVIGCTVTSSLFAGRAFAAAERPVIAASHLHRGSFEFVQGIVSCFRVSGLGGRCFPVLSQEVAHRVDPVIHSGRKSGCCTRRRVRVKSWYRFDVQRCMHSAFGVVSLHVSFVPASSHFAQHFETWPLGAIVSRPGCGIGGFPLLPDFRGWEKRYRSARAACCVIAGTLSSAL